MKTAKAITGDIEKLKQQIEECEILRGILLAMDEGDTAPFDAFLETAQRQCGENLLHIDPFNTPPDIYRLHGAHYRGESLFIGALRAKLREPDKRAEQVAKEIDRLQQELALVKQRGQRAQPQL